MVDASTIKARLRISHDKLDDQIEEDIAAAKAEMIRVGISSDAVEDEDNPLIDKAIIAYCMWIESSDTDSIGRYGRQWSQWRDELRKSPLYKAN